MRALLAEKRVRLGILAGSHWVAEMTAMGLRLQGGLDRLVAMSSPLLSALLAW